jgi:hypothetical protein
MSLFFGGVGSALAVVSAALADVRFGSLADILRCNRHVRFTPKSGHGVAPSEQMSFAIAAVASGRGPGEDRLRPRCVPQLKFCSLGVRMILFDLGETQSRRSRPGSLPTLAVCAVLGLFAARVQRL